MKYLNMFILWCLPILCIASPSSELDSILNNMQALRADFVQTIYDNHGKAVQTSYGKMALQRPDRFRWEVKKPIPQLIVANETKLWIYDPDLEQVTIRALHRAAGDAPALLLSHRNATIDRDYAVKSTGDQQFKLIPRGKDNMFASIEMTFKNNQIQKMSLEDHLGHVTQIQFKQAETNISLPASLFTFKPKAGVDVIDETRRK